MWGVARGRCYERSVKRQVKRWKASCGLWLLRCNAAPDHDIRQPAQPASNALEKRTGKAKELLRQERDGQGVKVKICNSSRSSARV
jgi:hypothetical protein